MKIAVFGDSFANKILAELVCANLKPGIFTTEYTNFCFENISLDSILKPL